MADRQIPPWKQYDAHYRAFQGREGIPVHEGLYVEDIRTVPVDDWERTGARGAFVNLLGMEGMCDIHIHEFPPAASIKPQRHLFEELVFVVQGTGMTTLGMGDERRVFEWGPGALFCLPRNTEYVHSTAGSDRPVRLLSVTPLPLLYTLLQDGMAIWNVEPYDQWAEIADDAFYERSARLLKGTTDSRTYWDANFVPDATTFDQLEAWPERGGGGQTVHFPFRDTSMYAHISEFAAGRYKKAHRHHPGANVLMLSGEGYSLLWEENDDGDRTCIDWEPYTLFTPPMMWFHQHFNTSPGPARYLAMHAPQLGIRGGENAAIEALNPTNQIEYHEEDTSIRERFREELGEKGLEFRMDDNLYDP